MFVTTASTTRKTLQSVSIIIWDDNGYQARREDLLLPASFVEALMRKVSRAESRGDKWGERTAEQEN
jgi:hypothetical protein